ncbi:hypothetical protein D3C84_990580 [compost metagenome]
MLIWGAGGISLQIDRGVLTCPNQQFLVGHQESILALWPDRVLYRAFPKHAWHAFAFLAISGQLVDLFDPSGAHQDTTCAFHERHMLGIEQAERIFLT